ncbi:MAG: hypothetical protein LBB60_02635 [Desulfovibrio sp.]|nr:hypothetical protein [Desulfovibrio sp.]
MKTPVQVISAATDKGTLTMTFKGCCAVTIMRAVYSHAAKMTTCMISREKIF